MIQLIKEKKVFAIIEVVQEYYINENIESLDLNQLCAVFNLNSTVRYLITAYLQSLSKERYIHCSVLRNEIVRFI